MTLSLIADIVSLVLILTGSLLVFAASVGLARFGSTMSRVHPITKPQTVGLVLCILAALIRVSGAGSFEVAERSDLGVLVLLVLFAMITSPVTAQRVSRIARREGLYGSEEDLARNDRPAAKPLRRK